MILGALTYVACFDFAYRVYLAPVYEYIGAAYNPPPLNYLLLAWILSVLPSVWMPIALTRASQLAYWVLYLMVIVPSIFVPLYVRLNEPSEVAMLMLALFAGFAIVGTSYWLPLLPFRQISISRRAFWNLVFGVAAALALAIILIFRGNLRLVSFGNEDVLRWGANQIGGGAYSLAAYCSMLLSGAICPLLLGWGVFYRRIWLFILGAAGQVLVYAAYGLKGAVLCTLFIPTMYLVIKGKASNFSIKWVWSVALMVGGLSLGSLIAGEESGTLFHSIIGLVLMRTFVVPGLNTAQYFDFFQHNPHTWFSHIRGLSLFVHYPYTQPIGMEVGYTYYGTFYIDASSHFWASDGLAGMGLPGVLLISAVCAIVFWVVDSAVRHHDTRLVALLISYEAITLANSGLFTTILSGGLALITLFIYIAPPERNKPMPSAARQSLWRLLLYARVKGLG